MSPERASSAPNGAVVLACSGRLDASALIQWLKEKHGHHVVACRIDLGRVKVTPMRKDRALASGAVAEAIDAKEQFAEHHCRPPFGTLGE